MRLSELALGTFVPMLGTLRTLLEKGSKKLDPATMHEARLIGDMFPLAKQVYFACFGPLEGIAELTGGARSKPEDLTETYDACMARIDQTIAKLRDVDRDALDAAEERSVHVPLGPPGAATMRLELKGERYLRDWVLPHFYFHFVTAYDILRKEGVEIGKRDYLAHVGDAIRPITP